jgi:hypothetical protein
LTVIQLAHIARRAQILPRLAIDVAAVTCRWLLRLLRLLRLLASLTLSRCRLHRIAHLVLQPPPQAVLLQQRPALPDRIDQLTVVQLAHIARRAQILPRLAIDVAAVTCRWLLRLLRLLRLLGLLLCLLLLLPGLISGSARKLAPNLIYPSCRQRFGHGGLTALQALKSLLQFFHAHLLQSLLRERRHRRGHRTGHQSHYGQCNNPGAQRHEVPPWQMPAIIAGFRSHQHKHHGETEMNPA